MGGGKAEDMMKTLGLQRIIRYNIKPERAWAWALPCVRFINLLVMQNLCVSFDLNTKVDSVRLMGFPNFFAPWSMPSTVSSEPLHGLGLPLTLASTLKPQRMMAHSLVHDYLYVCESLERKRISNTWSFSSTLIF